LSLVAGFPLALAWAAIWAEVLFRGWLQPLLERRFGNLRPIRVIPILSTGNLLASLAFATLHLAMHAAVLWPAYLAVSLLLGVARDRSGGVAFPMALHLGFNGLWWACGGMGTV
jgi:membrane protease YdiL (CAAX protease family)